MNKDVKVGNNCIIGENVQLGDYVVIGHNCIIESDVVIGENTYIDSNTILRSGVVIGEHSFVGSNCILGEYQMDFCMNRISHKNSLFLGKNALIRSGSILYTGSCIGDGFQTGHHVTIREKARIGDHVSVGTFSDIQGNCDIGNYVRVHSNVHIGQLSKIDSFVWIFPYVVLTNDPTPPSNSFVGVHIYSFAVIATGALIMPGVEIGQDALIAAGAIVTKAVEPYVVVAGNPGKPISDVRKIKNKVTGECVYPWREHFGTYMPWEEKGFQTWFSALDEEQKELLGLQSICGAELQRQSV